LFSRALKFELIIIKHNLKKNKESLLGRLELNESLLKFESATHNHNLIVCNFYQRKFQIFNIHTSHIVKDLLENAPTITCLTLYGTDRIIIGVDDMSIQIWDLFMNECVYTLMGHKHWTRCLKLLNDGHHLVSGSNDATAKVWNLLNETCVSTLNGHDGSVLCLEESPNLNLIITGSNDGTIRLWDRNDKKVFSFILKFIYRKTKYL
jgi:WD40 repeat protein